MNLGKEKSPWTEERFETAKAMWTSGATASEISKVLACGISRNAVIGKMHRAGLTAGPAREKATKTLRPAKIAKARAAAVRRAFTPPPEPIPPPPMLGKKTLADCERGECRWPVAGEGAYTLFCCEATESTYCAYHAGKSVQPSATVKKPRLVSATYGRQPGPPRDSRNLFFDNPRWGDESGLAA